MNKTYWIVGFAVVVLAGCAMAVHPSDDYVDLQTALHTSFQAKGIATMDRLSQDLAQQMCSSDVGPSEQVQDQIKQEALAGVQYPTDGNYLGDWKKGEAIAQNGKGMTWSDAVGRPQDNGGSCYNCHQITKAEIAYGNLGPSLYNYGKIRGVTDPSNPTSSAIVKYTWEKLWNSRSYAACSNMPRFGHMGLLDQAQLRDVMALLLDPHSPVNQ